MQKTKQLSLAERIVQGKYESVREEKAAEKAASSTVKKPTKATARPAPGVGAGSPKAAPSAQQP